MFLNFPRLVGQIFAVLGEVRLMIVYCASLDTKVDLPSFYRIQSEFRKHFMNLQDQLALMNKNNEFYFIYQLLLRFDYNEFYQ